MHAASRPGRDLPAIATLLLLGVIFHGAALGGWWKTDDPQVLLQALRDSPAQVLFSPHEYRTLSTSSFTPLVTVSFDADLSAAGLRPSFFYLHQLLAALAAALALFFLGRALASPRAGWLAAALFLVAPTTVDAVRALMLRHYLEGAIAAAIALILALSKRGERFGPSCLSALFYLIATVEKEFYAPLPLFVLALSAIRHERLSVVIRRQFPYAVAAAVYLAWRSFMLGSGGGYGGIATASLPLLPEKVLLALAGGRKGVAAVILVALLLALLVSVRRAPAATLALTAASVVFLSLPLLYLAADFDSRYAFAAMVVLAVSLGMAAESRPVAVITVALLVVLAAAGWAEGRRDVLDSRRMMAEGRYVWEKPATAPALLAGSPGWYLAGLAEIRDRMQHSKAPGFFLSLQPFETGEADPARVLEAGEDGTIGKMGGAELETVTTSRLRFRPEAPLAVSFWRKGSELHWRVGPPGGRFTFVTWPSFDDFTLPPDGWRRIPEPTGPEWFRVRRDAADGSWTMSPTFPLPAESMPVSWERR